MRLKNIISKIIRITVPILILFLLSAYFIWNAANGPHGIKNYNEQLKIKEQAEMALSDAYKEQAIWRLRVNELKENELNLDMLDERSRIMLNSTTDDEIVIPYGKDNHLF